MKSLKEFIRESLDLDNLEWKMNAFFSRDEIQRSLFNEYIIDRDITKALQNGFDIKNFVNFIWDDISPELDKDYVYQLNKIVQILKQRGIN